MAGYSVKKVLAIRDKLVSEWLTVADGHAMVGDVFLDLVAVAKEVLPGGPFTDVLRRSMVDLLGRTADKQTFRAVAWRLAGNHERLARGVAALPWRGQRHREWCPSRCVLVEATRKTDRRKEGAVLTWEVLAGTPAGRKVGRYFSLAALAHSRREWGFAKRRVRPENHPPEKPFLTYERPEQLFGLRVLLLFEPLTSTLESPVPAAIKGTQSLLKFNRPLLAMRARYGFVCPEGFSHPCHVCPRGLDACPVACRLRSCDRRICPQCSRESWVAPDRPQACLVCLSKG
ncbi:MAG: hypothetical protein E6G97_18550 [Alphaproteobacteria bacterium]|nr:MAG: hypothetical protein E6G97_18550 [Alphaproteobacteria bacterium]